MEEDTGELNQEEQETLNRMLRELKVKELKKINAEELVDSIK